PPIISPSSSRATHVTCATSSSGALSWLNASSPPSTIPASCVGRPSSASKRTPTDLEEFPGGDARALGHRGHLRPHHLRRDRRLPDRRAESAVAAGDHVLAPDQLRVTGNALRDEIRMLDEVRLRLDDAGDQELAFGKLDGLEELPLVRVTRIRGLEGNGHG